jgi:16S rRNA (guanine(966)-N(2))-methyltransferase RsmD
LTTRNPSNRVRIIGGVWRSRVIRFPASADVRPTPDRVRETLFNWLGQDLTGRRCLDLFAGSGALGFEALSRGAAEVVMVERSRNVLAVLRENAARLGAGAPRLRLVLGDALHFLDSPGEARFDVVFVDPPYGSGLAGEVLARLPASLARDAVVYVESDARVAAAPPWRLRRAGRAGAVHYHLIEWRGHDHGGLSGNV